MSGDNDSVLAPSKNIQNSVKVRHKQRAPNRLQMPPKDGDKACKCRWEEIFGYSKQKDEGEGKGREELKRQQAKRCLVSPIYSNLRFTAKVK